MDDQSSRGVRVEQEVLVRERRELHVLDSEGRLTFLVDLSSDSTRVFGLIEGWLSTCVSQHRSCGDGASSNLGIERQESILPLRVIDVGPGDGSTNPRLFATAGRRGKYATLSYRWGTSPTLTTTSKTFASHEKGIEMGLLPKTLRDAVHVTRKIGLRYLWIDSLCIIQDSSDDWTQQASQMHVIYQNAWVTISADSAAGSDSGFLNPRNMLEIRPCQHVPMRKMIHPAIPNLFSIVNQGGLSERGWILQERIFSRRIIHFGRLEVGWECKDAVSLKSEREPDGVGTMSQHSWRGQNVKKLLPTIINTGDGSTTYDKRAARFGQGHHVLTKYYAWYELVEEYSERLLTFPEKDKLTALSGIARTFEALYGDDEESEQLYISGLWFKDIARGLAYTMSSGLGWRQSNGLPEIPKCDPENPQTWTYRAPSFSWTAFDDTAKWNWPGRRSGKADEIDSVLSKYDCQFVKGMIKPSGLDSFGPVEYCSIVLRGVVCQREEMEHRSRIVSPDPDQPYGDIYPRTCFIRLCVDALKGSLKFVQNWLVLYPVGVEGKEFRRLGLMTIHGDFSLDRTEMTDIKLV